MRPGKRHYTGEKTRLPWATKLYFACLDSDGVEISGSRGHEFVYETKEQEAVHASHCGGRVIRPLRVIS